MINKLSCECGALRFGRRDSPVAGGNFITEREADFQTKRLQTHRPRAKSAARLIPFVQACRTLCTHQLLAEILPAPVVSASLMAAATAFVTASMRFLISPAVVAEFPAAVLLFAP